MIITDCQVAVALCLRHRSSGREICVATTHLKARSGPLLAALRAEQGGDLLAWLDTVRAGRPLLLTGDFNAAPSEPVVDRVTESGLQSSYCLETTEFTSWKVRDTGEEKQVQIRIILETSELVQSSNGHCNAT